MSRVTFAHLYCNKKSEAAFHQLFYELFDSIHRITGTKLVLRPFFPDTNCHIVMLDGEVAQALGMGSFLSTYNQPVISNIHTTDKIELLTYSLKTCTVHFQRHIDELSKSGVLPDVIQRLKSILGLDLQDEIDAWHVFCASQTHPKVQQWYLQKLHNPWYLLSINAYLLKVALDDWKITPRTTNIAETSHAATNADTSTSLPLLPAILVTQDRDKDDIKEIHQTVRNGIMRKRWNGSSARERLAEQWTGWSAHQRDEQNDDIVTYDALAQDREEGQEEWCFSLTRGHELQEQIQLVSAELKLDRRQTDLSEELKMLQAAVEFEKQARRDWVSRRGEIDAKMKALRAGPLKGVQINRSGPAVATKDAEAAPNDSNEIPEQHTDKDIGDVEGLPSDNMLSDDSMIVESLTPSLRLHSATSPVNWDTGIELDPALEPNYHALGGSDYPIDSLALDHDLSASGPVPPLPPPSPSIQPPVTSESGLSRARRRKRDPEVDPANQPIPVAYCMYESLSN
ncbi:hypothetical protein C8F01DRAFT_1374044 [Mycena amicta]|nr:hypothetical protein C8F01DRAFT_1374044 [Mycena amicta]